MTYLGEDLIIAMGAPGSRWSGTIRTLTLLHKEINMSDESDNLTYDKEYVTTESGRVRSIGWHRGAYWGPYHKQGHKFDKLDSMSKDEIVSEFQKPFSNWDYGTKFIKSHWFSYHIPQLMEMFPRAKFLAVYMKDKECFDWWHEVGGWDIKYPHYTWYNNDERMMNQIKTENSEILKYFDIKQYRHYELSNELKLSKDIRTVEQVCSLDKKIEEGFHEKFSQSEQGKDELVDMIIKRTKCGVIIPQPQ